MIDREARNHLAESLRHFAAGRLTWCDFITRTADISPGTSDPAVQVILTQVWHRYSCGCEDEGLDGEINACCERCRSQRRALDRTERREVARWIVFLYSDIDFEWQFGRLEHAVAWYAILATGCLSLVLGLGIGFFLVGLAIIGWLTMTTDGAVSRRLGIEGDRRIWPFFRQSDFEAAVRQPRLFGSRPA